ESITITVPPDTFLQQRVYLAAKAAEAFQLKFDQDGLFALPYRRADGVELIAEHRALINNARQPAAVFVFHADHVFQRLMQVEVVVDPGKQAPAAVQRNGSRGIGLAQAAGQGGDGGIGLVVAVAQIVDAAVFGLEVYVGIGLLDLIVTLIPQHVARCPQRFIRLYRQLSGNGRIRVVILGFECRGIDPAAAEIEDLTQTDVAELATVVVVDKARSDTGRQLVEILQSI